MVPRTRAAAVLETRAGDRAVKQPRGQRHVTRPATHRLSPAPRRTGGPARRRRLFEEALAVVERDYHSELTIEKLGGSVFASRRQLQRVFAEAGTSVSAVLLGLRMDHAAELLREPGLSVGAVGRAVGYREASQFTKAFKRRHGVTPSRWRETTIGARPTRSAARSGRGVSRGHPAWEEKLTPTLQGDLR